MTARPRMVACPVPHCGERRAANVVFCWNCTDLAGASVMEDLGRMERAMSAAPSGDRRVTAVAAYNTRLSEVIRWIDGRLIGSPAGSAAHAR